MPTYIPQSNQDLEFRRKVKEYIDSAKNEVLVMTGEFGLYGYPEIRESIVNARKNTVRIAVYETRAPEERSKDLLSLGCDVTKGSISLDTHHYLVVDRSKYIISEQTGREQLSDSVRNGMSDDNDPVTAERYAELYTRLKLNSEFWSAQLEKELSDYVEAEAKEVVMKATKMARKAGRPISQFDVASAMKNNG